MKRSVKHKLKTLQKRRRFLKTRKCRNMVRNAGGNQTSSPNIIVDSIQGIENTSSPGVIKISNQPKHTKIIHIIFFDEQFDTVKIEDPGIEYINLYVNQYYEFGDLEDYINKDQKTLIYSSFTRYNNSFI